MKCQGHINVREQYCLTSCWSRLPRSRETLNDPLAEYTVSARWLTAIPSTSQEVNKAIFALTPCECHEMMCTHSWSAAHIPNQLCQTWIVWNNEMSFIAADIWFKSFLSLLSLHIFVEIDSWERRLPELGVWAAVCWYE